MRERASQGRGKKDRGFYFGEGDLYLNSQRQTPLDCAGSYLILTEKHFTNRMGQTDLHTLGRPSFLPVYQEDGLFCGDIPLREGASKMPA